MKILLITLCLLAVLVLRGYLITAFTMKWEASLKDDEDARTLFAKRFPSFWRMLFSLKPVKDKYWVPADLRAAKYTAEASPEVRQALKKYVSKKSKNKK